MKYFIIHNGEVKEIKNLVIGINDSIVKNGRGVFETLLYSKGKIREFEKHWHRLKEGCSRLEINVPKKILIKSEINKIVKINNLDNENRVRVRITISENGIGEEQSNYFIESNLVKLKTDLIKAIVVPFRRNDKGALVGIKSINYAENSIAISYAKNHGSNEAIFFNTENKLCEATQSNIFVKISNQWITPPTNSGCLPGITREIILDIAKSINLDIKVTNIDINEFKNIESAFLTSTVTGVRYIDFIENKNLNKEDLEIQQIFDLYKLKNEQ